MCVVKIKMNVYQDNFSYTNFMFRVCCAVSLALLARYVIFLCFSLHISHTSHRLMLLFFFLPQQDTLNLLKIFIAWESACSRVINTIYTSVRDLFELDYILHEMLSSSIPFTFSSWMRESYQKQSSSLELFTLSGAVHVSEIEVLWKSNLLHSNELDNVNIANNLNDYLQAVISLALWRQRDLFFASFPMVNSLWKMGEDAKA